MFMNNNKQKNVLDEDLEECSNNPLTGWYRDGCCNTDENDHGVHTVCAKVTTEFLEWLKVAGNDLITPHPEYGFPGLKDGDGWCVGLYSFSNCLTTQVEIKLNFVIFFPVSISIHL